MSSGDPDFDMYPVAVELRFRSKEQRDEFMGGLSDGFGENHCQLDWHWKDSPRDEFRSVIGFDDQTRFAVDLPFDENEFASWEEMHAAEVVDDLQSRELDSM